MLPEVQERADLRQIVPEAQALRTAMIAAIRQVARDLETVPGMNGVRLFWVRYLEGKNDVEIADELGVSREWVSRRFRSEGLALAGNQLIRVLSREDASRS